MPWRFSSRSRKTTLSIRSKCCATRREKSYCAIFVVGKVGWLRNCFASFLITLLLFEYSGRNINHDERRRRKNHFFLPSSSRSLSSLILRSSVRSFIIHARLKFFPFLHQLEGVVECGIGSGCAVK